MSYAGGLIVLIVNSVLAYEDMSIKKIYSYKRSLLLQTDVGWGEIAPLAPWSQETFDDAKQELFRVVYEGAAPTLPSVRFGVASAMRPLKSIQIPFCPLHRPKPGATHIKLKAKTPLETIEMIKPFLGKYKIRLDCNRRWSLDEALFFISHFSPNDFDYLEEPVSQDLPRFAKLSKFPIALDETYRENPQIAIDHVKAIVIKPTLSGFVPKSNLPIILSSCYETSLGHLNIAELADPNLTHGLDTFQDDVLTNPLQVKDGHLTWEKNDHPVNLSKLCPLAP
jgi:O-succinylbenzoate synthase